MDNNFFKKIRILDGGMGQLLLEKGMVSMGLYGLLALYWMKNIIKC